jgi:fructokinase
MAVGAKTICGLGELLWDLLPGGEQLGGAPANFAVMAARLGNHGVIASRLGADARGESTRTRLSRFPVDCNYLQTDVIAPTGTASIEIADGEPRFLIHAPAAWDFLEWTAEWRDLATQADAVCFGTLGQRGPAAHDTIRRFLGATRAACVRVFDVNLRAPFFSADVIAESLTVATVFKLNEAEVPQVLEMLGAPAEANMAGANMLVTARWLFSRFPLKLVAVTRGGAGSLLVTRDASDEHPGVSVKVVDTVGAGDAFTAALIDAYLCGATLAEMNEAGNRWGAWVASQPGAMPPMDAHDSTS